MLEKKMQDALNDQINAELYSGYLYLAMSAWFDDIDMPGFSNWMEIQAQEELAHAMGFVSYVKERGGRVILKAIEEPQVSWDSPEDAFSAALEHEKYVTGRINSLVDISIEMRDHATNQFLQWYVAEQVEEEASAEEILAKLKMAPEGSGVMMMLDREMGSRTFHVPSILGGEED